MEGIRLSFPVYCFNQTIELHKIQFWVMIYVSEKYTIEIFNLYQGYEENSLTGQ